MERGRMLLKHHSSAVLCDTLRQTRNPPYHVQGQGVLGTTPFHVCKLFGTVSDGVLEKGLQVHAEAAFSSLGHVRCAVDASVVLCVGFCCGGEKPNEPSKHLQKHTR